MPTSFDDWYHHIEPTHWTALVKPGDESESAPLVIPLIDYKSPSLRGNPLDRYLKVPQFCDAQKLQFGLREFAMRCILSSLQGNRIDVMAISVAAKQVDILARFPDNNSRRQIGMAKQHTTIASRRLFELPNLCIWTKPGIAKPIRDAEHLISARNYIQSQEKRLAFVWMDSLSS